MVSMKSQVEVYLHLCLQLVQDDSRRLNPPKHLSRDVDTMKCRTASEGLSFLTKTLPKLGKALDLGLMTQRFTPISEFKTRRGRSTPEFLQAYFNRVFREDGSLLEDACVDSIRFLRQALFFVYKLEIPYSEEQETQVIESFVSTDAGLASLDLSAADSVLNFAALITEDVFRMFDPKEIVPRHGPGAVATGEKLEEKWKFSRLYDAIHQYYPYYDYYVVGGGNELIDRKGWYTSLERLSAGQAKVVLVPKDSRGPRLISAEPLEYQWIQQGLGRKLADHLESQTLTAGQVNFTHQDINQQLALRHSIDGKFATIDLKDASDRVGLQLVRRIFGRVPQILRALESTRTTETRLPTGEVVSLHKFAPMGSALCFPVEAYCFWVTLVSAMSLDTRMPRQKTSKLIYVYGDDIIVPTDMAERCIQVLESVGLAVNRQKTCIQGFFRESCGVDAFKGFNITPVKLKKLWSGRPGDGTALTSYTSVANDLRRRGYRSTSDAIFRMVEATYGLLPHGVETSGFPCRITSSASVAEQKNRSTHKWRIRSDYQRVEFMVKFSSPRRIHSELDSWPRLLRDVTSPCSQDPSQVVVPRSTLIKRGWRAC